MRELKLRRLALLLWINLLLHQANGQIAYRYSVVIDEILADPTPPIGLPNAEFIELKNVSDFAINLKQWKVSDGSSTATIMVDYVLQPDSLVVISSMPAVNPFSSFGAAIGVSNFPSLNNDEDLISLYSADGKLIHAVAFRSTWFNNAVKSEGGWTLEMIDTRNPCAGERNWKASIDPKGGTPARKNSVDAKNPDQQPPALIRSYVIDSVTAVAVFDESLDSSEAANPQNYQLDNLSNAIFRCVAISPLYNEVELKFTRPLQPGKSYLLSVTGVKDCSSNVIGVINKKRVGLPHIPDSLDVVINEILFNPLSDGVDYVELFNRSNKILDVSNLYIASRNAMGMITVPKKIHEQPYLFFPGDYLVISENSIVIRQHYTTINMDALLDIVSLPSLPDDRGVVLVLNEQGKILDELNYDQDWHFALVRNKEGVSLERIDPSGKTQWRDNWTSAASSVGYGTPGYQNSQYKTSGIQQGLITIEPIVFSPDNDGLDDICFIRYEMAEPNCVANVWVFDVQGRDIRKLYSNITLSQKGVLRWDGLGENFKPLLVGIYIINVEIFNLQGDRKNFRKVVTLARRF